MSELPGQAGFADAGLSDDRHDLSVTSFGPFEGLAKLLQLGLPADESSQTSGRGGLKSRTDGAGADELEYLHRSSEPLDRHRTPRSHLDVALDELEGSRGQKNGPRLGQLLQSRRQVRGLSHRGVVHPQVTADSPDHHLTRVEPPEHSSRDVLGAESIRRVSLYRLL